MTAQEILKNFMEDWPQFFDDSDDEVNGADLVDYISSMAEQWKAATK